MKSWERLCRLLKNCAEDQTGQDFGSQELGRCGTMVKMGMGTERAGIPHQG